MDFRKLCISSLAIILLNGGVLQASDKNLQSSDNDSNPPLFERVTFDKSLGDFLIDIEEENNLDSATSSESGEDSGIWEVDEDDPHNTRFYEDLCKLKSFILDHRSFINFSLGSGFSTPISYPVLHDPLSTRYRSISMPLRWCGGISMVMENEAAPQSFLSWAQDGLVNTYLGLDLLFGIIDPLPGGSLISRPVRRIQEYMYVMILATVVMKTFNKYYVPYKIKKS